MESDPLTYSVFSTDFSTNTLVQSNYIASSILASYVLFCKFIGPSIMKDRKPYDLKSLILVYNAVLVASNVYAGYVMTKILIDMWPYRCDIRKSPIYMEQQNFFGTGWVIAVIKFSELFDTVLFILRKKFNQVSFLHVFHHAFVGLAAWVCLKYKLVGYYIILICSINCSIHVLLYLYYTLSALGPEVRKYLWWKQYLTTMQIMQFFVILIYMTVGVLTGCEELDYFGQYMLYGVFGITLLFLNFYYRNYTTTKQE